MARKPDTTAATETLHEIESVFDRLAGWVTSNPSRFLALVGCILGIAAMAGFANWWGSRAEIEASQAVAAVMADYRASMGAVPGTVAIPEPANPELARSAREQAVEDLRIVAAEHAGRVSALAAFLQAGNLQVELEDPEGAIETWQQGLADAPAQSPVRGLLLARLGSGLEDAGRWPEAAASHADAAEIEAYPGRYYALADAARCYAEAGERDQAIATFDRLEAEAPDLPLPGHVRSQLRELRLGS